MWGFYFVLYLLVLVFSDVPGSRRNLVGISWLFGSSPPTLFQTFLLLYSFSSPSSMPLIHTLCLFCCCSVSHVWLWPQGLQHTRLSCPSPSPGAYSHSCPLSRWCHQTVSSSAIPFISCLQFFPASGSFLMSQLFASSGQSIGFSFNISPSDEYSGLISFRMDWLDFLAVQGTLKSLLQYHSSKASILWHSASFMVQLSHPYMTTGKTIGLD